MLSHHIWIQIHWTYEPKVKSLKVWFDLPEYWVASPAPWPPQWGVKPRWRWRKPGDPGTTLRPPSYQISPSPLFPLGHPGVQETGKQANQTFYLLRYITRIPVETWFRWRTMKASLFLCDKDSSGKLGLVQPANQTFSLLIYITRIPVENWVRMENDECPTYPMGRSLCGALAPNDLGPVSPW